MLTPDQPRGRPDKALQGVTPGICAGCGRTFTPARRNQRHCRPSCWVLAFQQRRAQGVAEDDQGDAVTRGLFE